MDLLPLEPALPGVLPVRGSGRCQLHRRHNSRMRCPNPAVGTVPDWTAPLDPELATPACADCAALYRVELEPWLV